MESGLVKKYWSQLNFEVNLRNLAAPKETGYEVRNDMYLVLSLFHLRVMFVVLGFGYMLSVAVFLCELICKWHDIQRTVTT
jgi:hypothetical protein